MASKDAPGAEPHEEQQLPARLTDAVRRICPAWLRAHADDVVSSAITRILTAQQSREGNLAATTFFIQRAAYCALIDEIRRRRRNREDQAPEALEHTLAKDNRSDPERALASREIGRGLRDCLAGLPLERRLACVVRLQGHSVPESARLLGWGEKKTDNLVYRGMADLRRCLEAKGLRP